MDVQQAMFLLFFVLIVAAVVVGCFLGMFASVVVTHSVGGRRDGQVCRGLAEGMNIDVDMNMHMSVKTIGRHMRSLMNRWMYTCKQQHQCFVCDSRWGSLAVALDVIGLSFCCCCFY